MSITAENAYRFSDNYTIQTASEPVNVFGCEHNKQEAEAVARWLEGEKGIKTIVVYNRPDVVRSAKQFRAAPFRFQYRETALKEMGVWR